MVRQLRRERGQDLVEFAIVLPVILLLILGILQLAMVIMTYNTLGDAAREGARWAVIGERADNASGIAAAVHNITNNAAMPQADVHVTSTKIFDSSSNEYWIRVDVTYRMNLFFPLVIPTFIDLHAVSTKLIELA